MTEERMALIEPAEQHAGDDFLRELARFTLRGCAATGGRSDSGPVSARPALRIGVDRVGPVASCCSGAYELQVT